MTVTAKVCNHTGRIYKNRCDCPTHTQQRHADNNRRHAKERAQGKQTSWWRRFRLWILNRDNHVCADCGGKANTVHYIPGGKHVSTNPADYISLCRPCHGRRDAKRATKQATRRRRA